MAIAHKLLRPSSVAIFKRSPAQVGKVIAFILSDTVIPSGKHVRFDLSKSRDYGIGFDVTRNPVEMAAADNILRRPETINVIGRLSANPLGRFGVGAILGSLGSLVRRDLVEVEKLRKIASAREPVIVVTPERTYTSMAIVSMNERYDETTGNGVLLSLTFEHVQIVSPLAVEGVIDIEELLSSKLAADDMGSQAATSVPDPGGLG